MSKKKKAKMGRPPLPTNKLRSARVTIRMTERERVQLKADAKRKGVSIAKFLLRLWRER